VLLAARCKCRTQKNRQKFAICAPSHKFVGLHLRNLGTYRQLEKNFLDSNICPTCLHNMVIFGPLALRSVRLFGAPKEISTGFASWLRYCTAFEQWAPAKLCGVKQRAPAIFGRAAITLGIGPHSRWRFFASCIFSEPSAARFRPAF